jgi:cytochrome c-type biogenesis protein CcmH
MFFKMYFIKSFCLLFLLLSLPSFGAIEEYFFNTEEDEERFRKLTYEMRCPKCLNAPIADSDAPIAGDLREEVFVQISDGRSNEEIKDFMSSRYGDFILYRPRLTPATFLLWFGPALMLMAGLFIVRRMMKKSQAEQGEIALSSEEQESLRQIFKDKQD